MASRYRLPLYTTRIGLPTGSKEAASDGWFYPKDAAEEAALLAAGCEVDDLSDPRIGGSERALALADIEWKRPSRRRASSSAINLPDFVERAAWWPLNETSGTIVTDRISGITLDIVGTATNAFDNPGWLTFNTNVSLRRLNNRYLDDLFRSDTLDGSIIVGYERTSAAPSSGAAIWGYGDVTSTSGVGGLAGYIQTANDLNLSYGVPGVAGVVPTINLGGNSVSTDTRVEFWAIHRLRGMYYVDSYINGLHFTSRRDRAVESSPPLSALAQGFRIAGRPNNNSGGTTTQWSGFVTLGRMRNFVAARLAGDHRHNIPAYIADMTQAMALGLVPQLFA